MTLDTYYWFFSTTAQVFGALIAILGVFTVYKLQWIQQSIEWSRKDLVKHMETFERNVVSRRLDEQLRMATEEIARQEATNGGHRSLDELKIITTIIQKRRQDRTDITESFLKLMRLMLLVLATALISIPFSSFLSHHVFTGCLYFVVMLIASIIALFSTKNFLELAVKRE